MKLSRSSICPALDDANNLFRLLAGSFLDFGMGGQTGGNADAITRAQTQLRTSLAKLKKAERDAKLELSYGYYSPAELKKVVNILGLMSKHLGAMASCVLTERRLLRKMSSAVRTSSESMPLSAEQLAQQLNEDTQRSQQAIHRLMTDFISLDIDETASEIASGLFGGNKNLFQRFVSGVAPAMKELTATCSHALDRLAEDVAHTNQTSLQQSLNRATPSRRPSLGAPPSVSPATLEHILNALHDFDSQQRADVRTFFHSDAAGTVVQPVREEFFLAFFFVFGLREFARQVHHLVEEVDVLKRRSERGQRPRLWIPQVGFFKWLSAEQEFTVEQNAASAEDLPGEAEMKTRVEGKTNTADHAFVGRRLRQGITKFAAWFGTLEARFAMKIACATVVMGLPGILEAQWFHQGLAVWAVVTLAVVMSPTVGASLLVGAFRVLGTLLGAVSGLVVWLIAHGNPYIMSVCTVIWSYPFCWVYLNTSWLRLGVTALFTYALVLLAAYTASFTPDGADNIYSYAWKRSASIVIGMIAAIFLNVVVWPYKARVQLRLGVSKTIHNIGILYSSQATLYISAPDSPAHKEALRVCRIRSKKLQSSMSSLDELINLTHLEFRLSSPFPRHIYADILQSLHSISDRLTSMITMSSCGFGHAREEYILAVVKYRKDMYKQILLYLHVLATSLRSKVALPASLPPARVARLRLIAKLHALPKYFGSGEGMEGGEEEGGDGVGMGTEGDGLPALPESSRETGGYYTYYFAYAQAEEELIEELERLAGLVRRIVGQDTFATELFELNEFRHDAFLEEEKHALLGGGNGSSFGHGSSELLRSVSPDPNHNQGLSIPKLRAFCSGSDSSSVVDHNGQGRVRHCDIDSGGHGYGHERSKSSPAMTMRAGAGMHIPALVISVTEEMEGERNV
ncbi:hypothetical protein HDV00_011496 [Rhizophlyctis rosea]|nr:hypothetical protein HDV00_011496 [Rhizophlyctis rosea]